VDRSFVAANARELARMRALVERLSDRQLGAMVNEYWSVAGVLGHLAFWDGCALYFARKLQRSGPFTANEGEPEDVDWINDSSRPLIQAIAPRALSELAVSIAERTDELVASLTDELLTGLDESSPLNPLRADHRGEHRLPAWAGDAAPASSKPFAARRCCVLGGWIPHDRIYVSLVVYLQKWLSIWLT
jgi:DinB superfamily